MRTILGILGLMIVPYLSACGQTEENSSNDKKQKYEVMKSEKEWKKELTEKEYEVLRKKGTEPAYTGKYYKFDKEGTFVCAACGNPLFSSEDKYSSGTGWPSFYDIIKEGNVETKKDMSMGWERTEVVCGRCGSHLGHVFPDGPEPTGLRYCVNSVSLDFKPEEKEATSEEKERQ